jgi:tight adherence protein B
MMVPVLVVFLSIFLLASVAVWISSTILQKRQQAAGDVSAPDDEFGAAAGLFKLDELSSIALWDKLLNRFDFVDGMRTLLAEADLAWSVGRLTSLMLLVGAVSMVLLSAFHWMPFWMDFLLACLCALLPYFYVRRLRAKRFRLFEEQFPDALDFLARCLRVGHPLPVSLEMLAQEEAAPLSTEMRKTVDERRLGMPLDQALDNLKKRMPILNVRLFVAAVKLQTRTGGKLSEVLGGLAETMREAASIEGEVRALAAHGRVTGAVLTVLPLGIATLMTLVNPGYLSILVDNPTGRIMIVACLLALVAAHFVIRKIVDVRL